MNKISKGLSAVPGYSFSAVSAGIRYQDRLDYSIIKCGSPSNAAGLFTTNKIFAAPVKLCRERIDGMINAILINSTNANACTGEQGYQNARIITGDIAKRCEIKPESVLMASTGIIGRQLPAEKMISAHDKLLEGLSPEKGPDIAKAIMTTDTFPKESDYSFETSAGIFTIGGTAKGSGMIAPDMATLLSFVLTNAPLTQEDLKRIFGRCVELSFNSISIDGDMSTNDSAIILSPASPSPLKKSGDLESFEKTLLAVLKNLADMLISDGEGATKKVGITVKGAKNNNEARMIARAIAESLLVKTAFFGEDPNWGRIAAAAGYSGADVSEEELTISFGGIDLLVNGTPAEYSGEKLKQLISKPSFEVIITVGNGPGTAAMLTCDLSYDYVKINAQYST